jgi:hypothetical protein
MALLNAVKAVVLNNADVAKLLKVRRYCPMIRVLEV